ncbi:carbohydrate sulfotransferase 1-like isoform X1 [Mizuhopecten yessoensis]|uniref:carbohydrate sulfotransferase 1-like isoform X1 n=1 Tax=Mizuhopecten yessoensis TaxID=6573 RepID=UPI000B45BD03|nr:carbohydrate sulfotransferase 1-like isoform X1 [Mizuhopecten yessoensis]
MEHPVGCWKKCILGLTLIAVLICYYWTTKIPVKIKQKMRGPIEYENNSRERTAKIQKAADFQKSQDTAKELKDVPVVLLMTYMRSGSTFLGDIVQQLPSVLYSYEPLRRYMEKGYYLTRDRGSCNTSNGKCRNTLENKYRFIIDNIKKFFNCDSQKLDLKFTRSQKSNTWFQLCAHEAEPEKCVSKVISLCSSAVRIIKTIRLSMDVVQELMENIPNLKVAHLLRDPRGMINSRRKTIPYFQYNKKKMSQIARAVCDRYHRDISIGQSLKVKYPNRIKTVLYEQIAQRPLETSIRIFKFLGLQPKRNFKSWLMEHIAGDPKMSVGHPAFSTVRANSTVTANSWRIQLSLDNVMDIDRECSQVYEYTGYLAVKNSTVLKNLNISVRKKNTNFP